MGSSAGTRRSVRFAGRDFPEKRHVCAFFYSKEEEWESLLPYVREGLEAGDKAFHIVDPALRPAHLERMRSAGVDVDEKLRSGQLDVRVWEEAYLRGGVFDQNAMLRLIEEVLGAGAGGRLTRLIANMEWALLNRPGVNDLVEYETRLNYILPKFDDPVI